MSRTIVNLPIFPLPVYLLPEGITRLRIFEARYIKMVKVAAKGQGFVIFSTSKNTQVQKLGWGSWVEIINFDQGKDGVLEIDVKCKSLVDILSIKPDNDNLNFGDITLLEHWPDSQENLPLGNLSTTLESILSNNELLNELYHNKPLNNLSWVVARWLELLPISVETKNTFIDKNSYEAAKTFVKSIIEK